MKTKLTLLTFAAVMGCGISLSMAQDAPQPPPPGEGRPGGPPNGGDPKARLEEAFKKMDTNGDGKVSKEEFLAFEKQQAEERFTKMDANGDGVIDKQEVEEAFKKMREMRGGERGPKPQDGDNKNGFRRPEGADNKGARPRPGADNNKGDGNPQPPPGNEGGARPPGGPGAGGLGELFRRVMETGSVSKEEYQKISEEQFNKIDANHDGKITKDELEEMGKKMRAMMGNRGGQNQGGTPPEGGTRRRPQGDAPKQ